MSPSRRHRGGTSTMKFIASVLFRLYSSLFVVGFFIHTLPVVTCFVIPSTLAESPNNNNNRKTCLQSTEGEISAAAAAAATPISMKWFQYELSITAPSRGCHLITSEIQKKISKDISGIKIGMCNLFVQHTSASLTVNENADPDVRRDLETALNKIVPASWNHDGTFRHTMEGDDDMPGHVKTSLMGPSLNIPIRNGRLALGTWQGIYLNEHRDQGGWGGGHTRHIVVTLQGQG